VKPPAYLPVLVRMHRDRIIPPGRVTHIEIAHDIWCAHFRYGRCDCEPRVTLALHSPGEKHAIARDDA
jgi:hypothetical protein